ncbi:MAG: hypothetical protein KatS3mg115_0061 [Candidatus Poribacteria bacterium]|nr:MAG: hypothetical protein KatS3mg115_0061 [Candidatus Poribacteria bacterium]
MVVLKPRLIVELYEGWGFSGHRAVVVDAVRDLSEIGMEDRVFSLRVFKGPGYREAPDTRLVLYDRPGFRGQKLYLGPGFYPNLQDVVKHFGSVRSLRFEAATETSGPEWGPIPVIIEAYWSPNFGGRKTVLLRDVANAFDYGFNNVISSVRILKGPDFPRGGCRVTFYAAPDFSGRRLPIEIHPYDYKKEIPDLSQLPQTFDNVISSVQIEGWSDQTPFDAVVFEDRFDGTELADGWRWEDPKGGGRWQVHQGYLEMVAEPGQDLWFGANFDAPRLIRPAWGDFAIETRLPVDPALNPHGGLLVWKNESRFLRLEKTSVAHAFQGDVRFERHRWRGYELVGRGSGLRDARELYLRLERTGDVFVGWASADGTTWQYCGATVMGMSDPVWVGLHALAPGNVPATRTRFDYFILRRRQRDVMEQQRLRERRRGRRWMARQLYGSVRAR